VFRLRTVTVAAAALAAVAGFATPALTSTAFASTHGPWPSGGAVFVQTDNTAGNQIIAYQRAADGTLTQVGAYPTGGLGGVLAGSVVDHLASQGSLQYDPLGSLLFAVNAGSNTVSVFSVFGDRLALRQILPSGGSFPVSVAVRGNLVYVLNALNGGSVQGYQVFGDYVAPLPGSLRALGLNPTETPQFTSTPGQVAFSPDGTQLIVTTKNNGNDIDVFQVGIGGWLSRSPVVNAEPGTVPFGIAFDTANNLATFTLGADGTVTPIDQLANGQKATCWVAPAGQFLFAGNAGSGTETGYSSAAGQLTLIGETATDAGTVDASATPDGQFLYVQAGGPGNVDEFSVGAGGSLTPVGSVTVPGAVGGEGIVAL
jgi:6-phosphogluconolactonase (cycloisomerase 2 family)